MYQFKEAISDVGHFWFDKKLIENHNWAILSQASKAVYPVMAMFMDSNGLSFPGERTIAILSGRTDKVARQGIRGLEGFPAFRYFEKYTTRRGKSAKRYYLKKPPEEHGRSFPFHRRIIEGGNWKLLAECPTAQALYPVMRCFGFFDYYEYDLYAGDEGEFIDVFSQDPTLFINRDFDLCEAETGLLAKHAGIDRHSVSGALRKLEDCELIEHIGDNRYKVFLNPPRIFKRAFLNEQIHKAYGHELAHPE